MVTRYLNHQEPAMYITNIRILALFLRFELRASVEEQTENRFCLYKSFVQFHLPNYRLEIPVFPI